MHLRVELQSLWRLPRSNAILFVIRCYLISLDELVTVPKWARRLPRVLKACPLNHRLQGPDPQPPDHDRLAGEI